jgi:predicted phosphodiesterase
MPIEKASVARAYRKKHGAEMPTLKLARIMYKENSLLFKDVEDARSRLRAIEGKHGSLQKKRLLDKSMVAEVERPRNPYKLPDSDETSFETYHLKGSRVFLLSDVHIPYHSIDALTAAFDFAKKEKPDVVMLNGDIIDCFALSRYCKDPKKRHFAGELAMFKEFFDILDKTFPNAKKVLKTGNHEDRYEQFLWQKAGELEGVEEFSLENIIKARASGIEVIKDKRIINYNGLNIIHGHEFSNGFFSPVNVARGLFLRAKTSAIQGHNHQTSEHTESDMNGKMTTTWSVGCLCELHPAYAPINKWNHGFSIIDASQDGFEVRNKRIYKSKVL